MTPLPAILAEVRRELAHRRAAYPGMVAKGAMHAREADHEIACMEAIAADLAAALAFPKTGTPPLDQARGQPVSWAAKRASLSREIGFRQRLYPQWARQLRAPEDQLRQQLAALEACLQLYDDGLCWQASNGHTCDWGTPSPSPQAMAARAEWQALTDARTPTPQKELAL